MTILASTVSIVGLAAGLAAACVGDDDYRIEPQSSPTAGGAVSPGGSTTVTGRVCRLEDLRDSGSCAEDDLGGLVVTLGNNAAITDPDGTFTIDVPADLDPTVRPSFGVSGPGVVATSTPFAPSVFVPVVDADVFSRTFTSNGILLPPDTGTILGRITRGGLPAVGITVASMPASAFGPFFDAGAPNTFNLLETGPFGATLIPGVVGGSASLRFSDRAGSFETVVDGVQVIPGGVTFVDTVLPGTIP